jgi:hypothetical protein
MPKTSLFCVVIASSLGLITVMPTGGAIDPGRGPGVVILLPAVPARACYEPVANSETVLLSMRQAKAT